MALIRATPVQVAFTRLIREALANLVARLGLGGALTMVAASLLAASIISETNAAVDVRSYHRHLNSIGYSVLLVGTRQDSTAILTPDDCVGLGSVNGVRAAIWMGKAEDGRWFGPGGPPVPVRTIGGDVAAFLAITNPDRSAQWDGAPVLIDLTSTIAAGRSAGSFPVRLQVGAASPVRTTGMAVELTMMGGGLEGNTVVIAERPGRTQDEKVESCVLFVDELHRASALSAVPMVFGPNNGYTTRWVLANADEFESPQVRFESRRTQWIWLVSAAVFVVIWGLYLRLRRSEFGVYSIAGLNARQISVMIAAELTTIVGLGTILAAVVVGGACLKVGLDATDVGVGLRSGGRFLICSILATVALGLHEARRATTTAVSRSSSRLAAGAARITARLVVGSACRGLVATKLR